MNGLACLYKLTYGILHNTVPLLLLWCSSKHGYYPILHIYNSMQGALKCKALLSIYVWIQDETHHPSHGM